MCLASADEHYLMSFYSPNNFVSAYTCFICVYQLHTVTDVTFKGAAIF